MHFDEKLDAYSMKVSVADAKTNLSKLLEAVEQGETILITRHGKPVATLTQAQSPNSKPVLGSAGCSTS